MRVPGVVAECSDLAIASIAATTTTSMLRSARGVHASAVLEYAARHSKILLSLGAPVERLEELLLSEAKHARGLHV